MPGTTTWILGDQLLAQHPALALQPEPGTRVLLIESQSALRRRPYHPHKLTLLVSAMRHYAGDLSSRGYTVDYRHAATYSEGLNQHLAHFSPDRLQTMAASSYDGRRFQATLAERLALPVAVLPNTQFLIGRHNPLPKVAAGQRVIMERFYRAMRRHFDVLMDGDQPAGGQWNFDKDNRQALPPSQPLPEDEVFPVDDITAGTIRDLGLPPRKELPYAVSRADAHAALERFVAERLPGFGPFEDALTRRSPTVFHSVLSPYLNLGLLEPMEAIRAAEHAFLVGHAPIQSVEGFIRQILGWREYMAWQYWRLMPELRHQNAWDATREVPEFFWTGGTDMACLSYALGKAIDSGYNHHIERLMLLTNFLMLAGVNPALANEWFLSMYVDAYDWVMAPNVIGMGLHADDGLIATKPYIASANYINKMGDHCGACRYQPSIRTGDLACPFNFLYWNFLLAHEEKLRANPRFGPAVLGLRHLDAEERHRVRAQAAAFLNTLASDADHNPRPIPQ